MRNVGMERRVSLSSVCIFSFFFLPISSVFLSFSSLLHSVLLSRFRLCVLLFLATGFWAPGRPYREAHASSPVPRPLHDLLFALPRALLHPLPFPLFHHIAHSPLSLTAGEILAQSLSQLERDIHPVVIISAYNKALTEALAIVKSISVPIDTSNDEEMLKLIKTSIGTKFVVRWSELMCRLALDAVRTVSFASVAFFLYNPFFVITL